MSTEPAPHEQHPARFEAAALKAHGTIAGWMLGNGIDPPDLTDILKTAYERAFAAAFDSGYRAAEADFAEALKEAS